MTRIGIVSGYFAPLHEGHLEYIRSAKSLVDKLIVIVNNDTQLRNKRGFIPMNQDVRISIMQALRDVDEVRISVDEDPSVNKTLQSIYDDFSYEDNRLYFFNDGDGQLRENVKGFTYVTFHHPKVNSSTNIIHNIQEGCNVQQSV